MVIRKIQPKERITASKIQSIAFLSGRDFGAASADSTAEVDTEKLIKDSATCRSAFNDNGKMCSCLELLPYQIKFDGQNVNMAGIGGVASLPEARNKGYIRELFKFCFNEMRENHQWFSYLYPFSNTYYRKYGYEVCLKKVKYTIPLTSFEHFPNVGEVKLYEPGTGNQAMKDIYNVFIAGMNLSVIRSDIQWNKRTEEDPYKNNLYTYIWYNDMGNPSSYVTFKANIKENFRADMKIQELVWVDSASLLGILGFLKGFIPRYEFFIWEPPYSFNFSLLFPEPNPIKIENYNSGMNRIVDLMEVLKLKKYPQVKGSLAFNVYDNFLEWNNGTFLVTWNENGVEVLKKECSADLSCSIQVMTQLITGYTDLEDYSFQEDVKIHSNYQLLSSIFKKKSLYINDNF